jgi:hypothetical protein
VEVRHINRSSSATRQPKVDTSTIKLCHGVSQSVLEFQGVSLYAADYHQLRDRPEVKTSYSNA